MAANDDNKEVFGVRPADSRDRSEARPFFTQLKQLCMLENLSRKVEELGALWRRQAEAGPTTGSGAALVSGDASLVQSGPQWTEGS